MSLIEEMKKFNRNELEIEVVSPYKVVVKSKHSLFRLGIWLEGYCTAYNNVYATYRIEIKARSKYFLEIEANHSFGFEM